MGNILTNANTNAFLFEFAKSGLSGYIIALFTVSTLLIIFDRLHKSGRNPSYIFLGFLYSAVIIEQAYTVAFISSGVGLLLFLTILEK